MTPNAPVDRVPYGKVKGTLVDRFGVWLSKRAIDRTLPNRPGLRAVEFGCGYHAKHLRRLHPRLSEAVAVDFTLSEELDQLSGFKRIEMPIEAALPTLPRDHFDVVLLISVLEHLKSPEAALSGIHQILAPGGLLLVNVPTWRGKYFLEYSAFRLGLSPREEIDDHKMYYDPRDLWPLLVKAGFRPSHLQLRTHKFGLNLFARATK